MSRGSEELHPDLPAPELPERPRCAPAAAEPERERPTDAWRITGFPVRVHAPYDDDRERG